MIRTEVLDRELELACDRQALGKLSQGLLEQARAVLLAPLLVICAQASLARQQRFDRVVIVAEVEERNADLTTNPLAVGGDQVAAEVHGLARDRVVDGLEVDLCQMRRGRWLFGAQGGGAYHTFAQLGCRSRFATCFDAHGFEFGKPLVGRQELKADAQHVLAGEFGQRS